MTANQTNTRAEVTILVCALAFGKGFHFCGIEKLQGNDSDLWFPLPDPARLFDAVERVMQLNGVAHNVVSLDVLTEFPGCQDIRVRYNRAQSE